MRHLKTAIISALMLIAVPCAADEGMWLLPLLEKMNINTMQQMGCRLTAKQIYDINNSLKDAVVIFGGGCTGEVVSPNGLLLTNHHCGYGSIQALSSVEHDYLTNGYWAMNLSEELPAAGLSVSFLEQFTDVTDKVQKAMKKGKTDEEKAKLMRDYCSKIENDAKAGREYIRASVTSFYGGNAYYLVTYKVFEDVRFVGAPPSSIGKFGADTDNWMWPRHTCDFSMFRIYADKDNNPAKYSPDNVPYKAPKSLEISLKGVKENDFSMIMGFPGTTNRFMTASELVQTRDVLNAIRIYCRGERQDILMEDMLADPKVKIQYASKYSGSSNGWKKYIGMNETFGKLNVEQRRAEQEQEFEAWVAADKKRQKKYAGALADINNAINGSNASLRINTYLSETVGRIELISFATRSVRVATASDIKDKNSRSYKSLQSIAESFFKDYSMSTDKKVAKRMLEIYRENVSDCLIDIYKVIDDEFGGSIDKYVDNLFETSCFTTPEKLFAAVEKGAAAIENDPALKLGNSVRALSGIIGKQYNDARQGFSEGKKAYIAGTLEMRKGEAIYPDANFTMRLTYGQVKPYSPKDGVKYNYYTTLKGVMQKEDPDNWEFVVPAKLKELYAAKDFGRYANENGEMPACFIMTGDITGGNSGSPVMDADGRLIGLAFDGNWEAMSGDIIFEPELQRCICVDIRYVMYIIDKFGGAGYLLDEMTIAE